MGYAGLCRMAQAPRPRSADRVDTGGRSLSDPTPPQTLTVNRFYILRYAMHRQSMKVAVVAIALLMGLAWPLSAAGRYFQVEYAPSTAAGELQIGVTYIIW